MSSKYERFFTEQGRSRLVRVVGTTFGFLTLVCLSYTILTGAALVSGLIVPLMVTLSISPIVVHYFKVQRDIELSKAVEKMPDAEAARALLPTRSTVVAVVLIALVLMSIVLSALFAGWL